MKIMADDCKELKKTCTYSHWQSARLETSGGSSGNQRQRIIFKVTREKEIVTIIKMTMDFLPTKY